MKLEPSSSRLSFTTPQQAKGILEALRRMGLIELDPHGKIRLLRDSLHLRPESAVYRPWRTQMRLQGLHQMDRLENDRACGFTAVFTADQNTRETLQRRFLAFLAEAEQLSNSAAGDKLLQMNFDLFEWI